MPPQAIEVIDENTYNEQIKHLPDLVKQTKDKIRLKRSNTNHLFGLNILDSSNELDIMHLNKIIKFDKSLTESAINREYLRRFKTVSISAESTPKIYEYFFEIFRKIFLLKFF